MHEAIRKSRMNFENLGAKYKVADDVIIEKEIIENIPCYWFSKKGISSRGRIILYLHGGCFALGSVRSHGAMVSHLSATLQVPALFIEYRLAPENPFPAAVQDILKVYRQLFQKPEIKEIVLIGDSAGAGLCISVISILNKENTMLPAFCAMLSPWIDLRCNSHSMTTNAALDPVLTKKQLQTYASLYRGSYRIKDANPIDNLQGDFPPTIILAGTREILLDDGKLAFTGIAVKQPNVKLSIYDEQTHVWLLDNIQSPASVKAMEEIRSFINDRSGHRNTLPSPADHRCKIFPTFSTR